MSQERQFLDERRRMVREQLQARGIRDPRVLEAFLRVPRHEFVPFEARPLAYGDHPLEIGAAQTISQPYMVATMLDVLRLAPGHRVLEIGTGSGYQTALLAAMGGQVFTVERIAILGEQARDRLRALGYPDVRLRIGDGSLGWPEEAPFDRILVSAGSPGIPEALVDQLAVGGRLLIPVGNESAQTLFAIERPAHGAPTQQRLCGCVFVPLIGQQAWPEEPPRR